MTEATPVSRVLVLDDDVLVGQTTARLLERAGHSVELLHDPEQALVRLSGGEFDLVVSDISMPQMTGIELLHRVRSAANDVPVVFVTGTPRLEDAMRAMELGAFRYLTKPVDRDALASAVSEGLKWRGLSRAAAEGPTRRSDLQERFDRALAQIRMVYQPIVSLHEALMRSSEPTLPSPPAVLEAAEKLGTLHPLGRRLREIVGLQAETAPPDCVFFVNVHSADLADPELYDVGSPLGKRARSVVLEITERASLEGVGDLDRRLNELRAMGYRLAVDDLGAGYAGLSYFAKVKPDIVKIDMSLVRDVHTDPVKQQVVGSLCSLARNLDILVVAEGIENREELAMVTELGAQLLQGYAIARPGPPYPEITLPPATG
jgi:EAL domain-containing protein (putative c-di-GMP-specific phosphodiesterase class I)